MVEQRIQQQFYDSADHLVQASENLAVGLRDAAAALTSAITAAARVHVYGHGASSVDAQRFVGGLLGRFDRERPALAAQWLGGDAAALAALGSMGWPADLAGSDLTGKPSAACVLAHLACRQLQAVASAGDVLLIVCADAKDDGAALRALVDAAHGRDVSVIALSGRGTATWLEALTDTDVWVSVKHERLTRVQEAHVVALHCLGDAVDLQLLGEQELE
jgi:D-sedoheptulose 7-phosphate isomerase